MIFSCRFVVALGASSDSIGVLQVTPTALMLAFAVLYFVIIMDAGLFDPLVRRVLVTVGNDPMRINVGTALLAMVVSLDGTTTALIVITAMLPVYRKTGMNRLATVANGSTAARAALDPIDTAPTGAAVDAARRPHLFGFNLMLTPILPTGMVLGIAPLPDDGGVHNSGHSNYPHSSDQRQAHDGAC